MQGTQAQGASASAHDIFRASTDTNSMEISMRSSDTTLQPQQVTSPTTASGRSSVDQVMDQSTQITVLSSFLGQKAGDNNMYCLLQLPGIGGGEIRTERLSYRNKAVKLLSSIQMRIKECIQQPQQQQQQTLS